MQSENRLFDDFARLFGSALGTLQGTKADIEEAFRQRLERVLLRMDLVSREEFETVRAMAEAARAENERLAARVAALEGTPTPERELPARDSGADPTADPTADSASEGSSD